MKKLLWRGLALSLAFIGLACQRQAEISVDLPESFEGKQIDIVSFCDSTVLSSGTVENGRVHFSFSESDSLKFPLLSQLMVDGRARGFYVIEPGKATLDSTRRVHGTPLNEKMSQLLARMDSADNLGMTVYVDEAEKVYNENKENVLASYFGIEWLKYAEPGRVDSLLNTLPGDWSKSRRAAYYINFAKLRAATSPGRRFADFAGEDASGKSVNFSQYVVPGHYTLVDFMASWCPYCIKDFPEVANLYNEYHDKGLNVVSVAVRDKPEDTAAAVRRHGLVWDVMYNTQKVPYDIYGFSGIPHYMLISPDGTIVVRGETFATIAETIRGIYAPSGDRD
ncbi:MAG: TlpA family protein disulfide reductase [Muribaculaceae bacterium]|nr:TlpA family protein disulfide reductase [Muribaculaceae bacterium]